MNRHSRPFRPALHTRGGGLPKPPLIPALMVCACGLLALALALSLASLGTREPAESQSSSQGEAWEEASNLQAGALGQESSPPQENSALVRADSEPLAEGEISSQSSDMEEVPTPEEAAYDVLEDLRDVFPEGMYWNHMGVEDWDEFTVTNTPCQHDVYWDAYCNSYTGGIQELFPQFNPMEQCLGFAALLSDLVFGVDAPVATFTDYHQLRVGDHIRLELSEHSMTVLTVGTDGITVVECNSDYEHCRISWDRFLSWDDLSAYSYEILCSTRYEDGAS